MAVVATENPLAITELYEENGTYYVTVEGAGANQVTILVANGALNAIVSTESAMQNVTFLDQKASSDNSVTFAFKMRDASTMAGNAPAAVQNVFVNSTVTGATLISDEIHTTSEPAGLVLNPTKISYQAGEDFDATGTLNATYADTIFVKKNISFASATVDSTAFDKDHGGEYAISVTYAGKTASYNVNVAGPVSQPSITAPAGTTATISNSAPITWENGVGYTLPNVATVTREGGQARDEKVLAWNSGSETVLPNEAVASIDDLGVNQSIMFNKFTSSSGNDATLRLVNNSQGLRFASEIDIDTYKALTAAVAAGSVKITKVGTMIAPKSYFADQNNIKAADFLTVKAEKAILDIATNISAGTLNTTTGDYKFGGVMTGILAKNFNRDFAGIGYIQYQIIGDNTDYYVFANDVASIGNPAAIADTVLADESIADELTGDAKGWVESVAAANDQQ